MFINDRFYDHVSCQVGFTRMYYFSTNLLLRLIEPLFVLFFRFRQNTRRSFKKQDVEIFATVMDEDTVVPVVPTFRTQSSSSSSQFDNKKYASSRNTTGGEEWRHDVGIDLNETQIHTFHDKDTMESDTKSDKINDTEQIVSIPMSPDTIKVVNDTGTMADREDIPSFREWTEKHLAEEEKERGNWITVKYSIGL